MNGDGTYDVLFDDGDRDPAVAESSVQGGGGGGGGTGAHKAGEKVEESGPVQGTAAGPPWVAIVIGVLAVGGIAAGLFAWLK